ncbi:hypothetical protein LPJ53_003760, partial [Coemansia erecta]
GVHLLVLARALWRWTDVALEQVRGDRFATWRRMLAATRDTRLVALLVARLARWQEEGEASERAECWAALVVWCVRTHNACMLVRLLEAHRGEFSEPVGARAFGQLLPPPEEDGVAGVAALGVAGLAYPGAAWAEPCVEQVVLATFDAGHPAFAGVLACRLLHLGIASRGFLPALLSAAPGVLPAIGRTLLTLPHSSDQDYLQAEGLMIGRSGGRAELLCSAVGTLLSVGCPLLAIEWTAEFLGVPLALVLPEHAARWVAQLECVVRRRGQVESAADQDAMEEEQEPEEEEPAWGSEPEVDLDAHPGLLGAGVEALEDEPDGWGDEDVDLDLHGAAGAEAEAVHVAAGESPEDAVQVQVQVDEDEDEEGAAWGDDDDIDLDAALNEL